MNSKQIEIFLMAARCRSFSEAASRLFLSPAAICRNIASLESELGLTLFAHENNRIALTEAGKIFLSGMDTITALYGETLQQALDADKGVGGVLSIGVLDGQMLDPITQAGLVSFEKSHPDIRLELKRYSHGDLLTKLDTGELDVVFTVEPGVRNKKNIGTRAVCQLETKIVLPQKHRLARKSGLWLKDFKNDVFIICSDGGKKFPLEERCRAEGFEPKILYAPDIQTQMLWLEAEKGISLANPNHMMCNSPALTEVACRDLHPENFVAAWHLMNRNPMVPAFISVFKSAGNGQ